MGWEIRFRCLYFVTLQLYDSRVVKRWQAAHRNQWTKQPGELVVLVQGRVTSPGECRLVSASHDYSVRIQWDLSQDQSAPSCTTMKF